MIVPLPPKQAPNANAHAKGPSSKPNVSSDANSITTGTIVAVYGILSMNAEAIADTHSNNRTATISLLASDALETVSEINSAIISINPIY